MVTWTGQIPFHRVQEELEKQDGLVITSLQESTTNVLMEALAAGLPVICHGIGGMSFAIDESCGLKIPLADRQTSISQFADAIARLAMTPGLVNRLSEGALRRAQALSWDTLVREIASAYDAIPLVDAA
jgi:glycosyltransferase involved in cell wall biosynthesis